MKETPTRTGRWRRTGGVLLGVALVATLCSGCGGDKGLPTDYSVAGQSIPALTVPEGGSMAETDEEIYTYEGVEGSGNVAKSYVAKLTGADGGFVVVDDTYTQVSVPDFDTDEGTVLMAKDADGEEEENAGEESQEVSEEVSGEESQISSSQVSSSQGGEDSQDESTQEESSSQEPDQWLITVKVDWAPEECVVTTSKVAGSITYPEGPDGLVAAPAMTDDELVSYVETMKPADLGLEGDSMADYRVYTMTGDVYVDGRACRRVQVYSRDNPSSTNHFEGLYLISGNGQHIYRVDPDTDAITPITPSA
ncbi:MAG: hypothetical protein ACOYJZ_07395 [Acutalibacter sp.]|jgi:hypothetical protein